MIREQARKNKKDKITEDREIAFYYPGPIWHSGEWIKNLLPFFDGIALLVPEYMKEKPEIVDPVVAIPLKQKGLLHILEPEKIINKDATRQLAAAIMPISTSGALDHLAKEKTRFHELSYSRLGGYGDEDLARALFGELEKRKLARKSEDGVSIPMHPIVRGLVLVMLAQILRPYGQKLGGDLSPVTDRPGLVSALMELLNVPMSPSAGHVVALDLETVGTDLSLISMDEVLGFRAEYFKEHRAYMSSMRKFVRQLSLLPKREQDRALRERQEEIRELANTLKDVSRKAWKRPATFAMSIAGAVWMYAQGDLIGAALSAGTALLGDKKSEPVETGAYSYLFRATGSGDF